MNLAARYRDLKPTPMLRIFERAAQLDDVINLGIGEPDFDTPREIIAAGCRAAEAGCTHYPPVMGFPDLRHAIGRHWEKKYGLPYAGDEILVTTGGIQGSFLALQILCDPGDEVLVTDPCFTPYLQQVDAVHGRAVGIPVREGKGFALQPEDLEARISPRSRVLVLNSPANPTGAVQSRKELEGIADIVRRHDLTVLSDEVYDAFLYEGTHVPFASLPGMRHRTFTLWSFSKTYAMTGWRIGCLMGPTEGVGAMRMLSVAQSMGVNTLAQKAALFALEHSDDFVAAMVATYRTRVQEAATCFGRIPGFSCAPPKGSFYLFVNIGGTGQDSVSFCLRAIEEARVALIPGVAFGPGGEGYVRIACTVSGERMAEAAARLTRMLRE